MRFPLFRRFLITAGLVLVLVATVLLLLPEVLRRVAINQLEASIAARVQIEEVDLNLFTGRARASGFAHRSRSSPAPFLPRGHGDRLGVLVESLLALSVLCGD